MLLKLLVSYQVVASSLFGDNFLRKSDRSRVRHLGDEYVIELANLPRLVVKLDVALNPLFCHESSSLVGLSLHLLF